MHGDGYETRQVPLFDVFVRMKCTSGLGLIVIYLMSRYLWKRACMGDVLSFPFILSLCILIRGLNPLVLPAVLPSGFPFERLPRSLILFLHLAKSHRLYDSPNTPEDFNYLLHITKILYYTAFMF